MKIRYLVWLLISKNIIIAHVSQEYHAYIWARYNHALGNEQAAGESYQFLLKQSRSPYIYPSFIEYLFDTGQYHAVVQLAPTASKLALMPPKVNLLVVQALQALGLSGQAVAHMEQLLKSSAEDPEIVYVAAQLYLQVNNIHGALQLIEKFLKLTGAQEHAPLFRLLQAQAFMLMQKYGPAKESLRAALAAHPAFDKALLLLGLIHELEGDHREAIRQYEHFLGVNGPHPMVIEQIRRLQQLVK